MTRRGFLKGAGAGLAALTMGNRVFGGESNAGGWDKYKVKPPHEIAGWVPTPEQWREFLMNNIEKTSSITKEDKDIFRQVIPFLDGKTQEIKIYYRDNLYLLTKNKLQVAMDDNYIKDNPGALESKWIQRGAEQFILCVSVFIGRASTKQPEFKLIYQGVRQRNTTNGNWNIATFGLTIE